MLIKPRDNQYHNSFQPISNFLFFGLILFFLFEYLRPGIYYPIADKIKLNTLIPIFVFFLTLLSNKGRSNNEVYHAISSKWLIWFIVLLLFQFIVADVQQYVYDTFKIVIGYLFIYYVILRQVTSINRIKFLFFVLVFIHVLLILLYPAVILQPDTRNYMAGTFLGDGNDFAWSTCIVIPFVLFLAQSSNIKIIKIFFYSQFVFLILAVIGTQSRGASIALACMIIYFVVSSRKKWLGIAGVSVLLTIVFLFAPQAYIDRMYTIKDYETEGSAQGRIMAWKAATNMALDHPLTGVGPAHFSATFGEKYKPKDYVGPYLNTHSIYFLMLGEFGFPGIIILLGLLLTNFSRNKKIIKILKISKTVTDVKYINLMHSIQCSLIGYIVAGAFLSGLYYPHLFILAALNESARYIAASKLQPRQNHN